MVIYFAVANRRSVAMKRANSRLVSIDGNEVLVDIISAIADAKGVDADELEPPLADWVDPESLVKLLLRSNSSVRISFAFDNQRVVVESNGNGIDIDVPTTEG